MRKKAAALRARADKLEAKAAALETNKAEPEQQPSTILDGVESFRVAWCAPDQDGSEVFVIADGK